MPKVVSRLIYICTLWWRQQECQNLA